MAQPPVDDISILEFTDITRRAMAAYWRNTVDASQPSQALSGDCTYRGLDYVVLANSFRVLAVYRVRSNGFLRRLKRWPSALDIACGQEE
ncbi:MAG TPA: hypothetical protein VLQ80_29265 [Candidatus Saccharimonadia bacterium]|nr:hypothetical protein [Candidatus Saccharimonadia bacterium]